MKESIEIKKKLGEKIKSERKRLRLTQKELANKIGLSEPMICGWERGKYTPNAHIIQKMYDLGMEVIEGAKAENKSFCPMCS